MLMLVAGVVLYLVIGHVVVFGFDRVRRSLFDVDVLGWPMLIVFAVWLLVDEWRTRDADDLEDDQAPQTSAPAMHQDQRPVVNPAVNPATLN